MPRNAQAEKRCKTDCRHRLLVFYTVSRVISRPCLALIGTLQQGVGPTANALAAAVEDVGLDLVEMLVPHLRLAAE